MFALNIVGVVFLSLILVFNAWAVLARVTDEEAKAVGIVNLLPIILALVVMSLDIAQ